jgi:hypothetical protein
VNFIEFSTITYVGCDKITDKVSRKAAAVKTDGLPTEQPAVRTDRFNNIAFATFATQ